MVEICNLLEVKHGIGKEDDILVESCETYDTALAGYHVICPKENLPGVFDWVSENMKDISEYIRDRLSGTESDFAFALIRGTLNINTYTQEFVESCGSVQAFLDKYGGSPSLVFSEEEPPEEKTAPVWESGVQGNRTEGAPVPISLMGGSDEEPRDDFGDDFADDFTEADEEPAVEGELEEEEPVPEPVEEASAPVPEPVEEAPEPAEEPVVEEEPETVEEAPEPVEEQVVEEEPEPEPVAEEESVLEEEPTTEAEELHSFDGIRFDAETNSAVLEPGEIYEVECDGISIPSLQFRDGKVIVPFSHLSRLVRDVLSASSVIEENDASGIEILTSDTKFAAANLVERYAPTVIKEFVLSYVRGAASDADLVRITKMLNEFCSFVAEKKILSFDKEEL